jgi:predicted phosphodiesterase
MPKFVYITDTHYGVSTVKFFEQPSYPQQLPALLALLDARIRQDPDIRFVVHGGDMVNECTEAAIKRLPEVFHLLVPVYLCLGNHDLTHPDALRYWLSGAPDFFPTGAPYFSLPFDGCFLHIVPNQWCEAPYYWQDAQDAHFPPDQLEAVGQTIRQNPGSAHIFCTHSNVTGILPEQTGFDGPYNSPRESFSQQVFAFADRHPQLRCVISGHTHVNSIVQRNGVRYLTSSSFVETPFEYKIFAANGGNVSMSTENFAQAVRFSAEYDLKRTFVQGRPEDRGFFAEGT